MITRRVSINGHHSSVFGVWRDAHVRETLLVDYDDEANFRAWDWPFGFQGSVCEVIELIPSKEHLVRVRSDVHEFPFCFATALMYSCIIHALCVFTAAADSRSL